MAAVYLIDVHLVGVYLPGVYFMGVHLIGVYLTGMYLMSIHLAISHGCVSYAFISMPYFYGHVSYGSLSAKTPTASSLIRNRTRTRSPETNCWLNMHTAINCKQSSKIWGGRNRVSKKSCFLPDSNWRPWDYFGMTKS
jgi:hypothetical protein